MTDARDVELVTTAGVKTSVLSVLAEMQGRQTSAAAARELAKSMERAFYGRGGGRSSVLEGSVSAGLIAPMVSKNKVKNSGLTWVARIAKSGTMARAYPNEASVADEAQAEVANAILQYQRQQQGRVALCARAALKCCTHGTVLLYAPWDPDAGRYRERDVVPHPLTGLPMIGPTGEPIYRESEGHGHQVIEPIEIFDFLTDGHVNPAAPWEISTWLLIRRVLDVDTAASMWRARCKELDPSGNLAWGVPGPTKVEDRLDASSTWEGVEAYEMWWRPDPLGRFADGMFSIVVGGAVTKATTFPYEHGEIPGAIWRNVDGPGFYGTSWVEDAMPLQRGLNHSMQATANRQEIAGQMRGLLTAGLKQKWGTAPDGMIEATEDEIAKGHAFVEVPDVPRDMYEGSDRYEAGIGDVAGVSEVAAQGDAAADTKNARLVAYSTQVDEQKSFITITNMNEAFLVVDRQCLEEWKQFVPRERLIRVIGEDGAVSSGYFNPHTEIGSVDVRLEVEPSTERTAAAEGKSTEEGAAAGFVDPRRAAEMRNTGLGGTVDEGAARAKLQALVHQALLGQPVQADPGIPPELAIRELEALVPTLGQHGARALMPIRALLHEYQQLKQSAAREQNPQQARRPEAQIVQSNKQQAANTLPGGGP